MSDLLELQAAARARGEDIERQLFAEYGAGACGYAGAMTALTRAVACVLHRHGMRDARAATDLFAQRVCRNVHSLSGSDEASGLEH